MNYSERKARGLCCVCGTKPSEGTTTRCAACRERHNERRKAQRARLRAQRLCTACKRNPAEGLTIRCIQCKAKRRKKPQPRALVSTDRVKPYLPSTKKEFSVRMAFRYGGKEDSYARQYERMRQNKTITLEMADKILTAFDRHLWEAS